MRYRRYDRQRHADGSLRPVSCGPSIGAARFLAPVFIGWPGPTTTGRRHGAPPSYAVRMVDDATRRQARDG